MNAKPMAMPLNELSFLSRSEGGSSRESLSRDKNGVEAGEDCCDPITISISATILPWISVDQAAWDISHPLVVAGPVTIGIRFNPVEVANNDGGEILPDQAQLDWF